jgi:hypothetical protein
VRNRRQPLAILVVEDVARAVAGLEDVSPGADVTTPVGSAPSA